LLREAGEGVAACRASLRCSAIHPCPAMHGDRAARTSAQDPKDYFTVSE
jgi:hypothetical protein